MFKLPNPLFSFLRRSNISIRTWSHTPVMVQECLQYLNIQQNGVFVDMTFGAGGHTKEMLANGKTCCVYAMDRDRSTEAFARQIAEGDRFRWVHGRFSELLAKMNDVGVAEKTVDGILMDVGASSMQFEDSQRGFSIASDGPLDMRMDPESADVTAADLVNTLEEEDLVRLFKRYGEEKRARAFAHAILYARAAFGSITRTKQLCDILATAANSAVSHDKLGRPSHVATKVFQALRIFVNDELNELHNGIECAYRLLKPGGRLVVISFHSLEDRIVKRHFHDINMEETFSLGARQQRQQGSLNRELSLEELVRIRQRRWTSLTNKGIVYPSEDEVRGASSFLRPTDRGAEEEGRGSCFY